MQFKTSLTLAVAASAMIFGSSMVMAEGKHEGKGEGKEGKHAAATTQPDEKGEHKQKTPEQMLQDKLDTLGLSDDQKAKAATIFSDYKKSNDSWEATHNAEKKELMKKYEDAKKAGDQAQIKNLEEQKKALFATQPSTKKLREDIKAILTPEQLEKFEPKHDKGDKGGEKGAAGDKGKEKKHENK